MTRSTITQIDIYKLDLQTEAPFRFALGVLEKYQNLIVRIRTESGHYGLGEGSPIWAITGETQAAGFEIARFLGQVLVGQDALAVDSAMRSMDRAISGNSTVKSAYDMALYDLAAKLAGMPLYSFLGGEKRAFFTNFTMGIDTPDAMAMKARKYLEEGALALKVKLGTSQAEDVARIAAIRDVVGSALLVRIDANQGWNVQEAIATLQELASLDIQYCEEPVAHWNRAGLKRVHEESPIPIMADETLFSHHDAFQLASMAACDYFNIKLAKCGGIHHGLKIAAIAESAGIPCMVGQMGESRLAVSACAHLISARPNIEFADLDSLRHITYDPTIGGVELDGAHVIIPDTLGHGADLDPAFLNRLESISITQ